MNSANLKYDVDVNLMHAILQHSYFKAPLFHYKTLLVHDSSIGSSELLSFELIGSQDRLQNQIFVSKKNLETSVHLSWKVLSTEAKTLFGIQKCKVRVCRIMKIAVNKARCLSKNSR